MKNEYTKHSLIDEELKWYDAKFAAAKSYLDSINLENLVDRMDYKETKSGGMMRTVVATKESQFKSFLDGMKEIPKILDALDNLRNKYEEKEFLTRGDVETKNTGMDFAKQL